MCSLVDMCSLVSDMPLYQVAGSWTGKDKVARPELLRRILERAPTPTYV